MAGAEREAWDRQPGESSWDFARFCRYRDLGPGRSVPKAVRAWLSEKSPRSTQQRRFRTAADPDDYVWRVSQRWKVLSRSWQWRRRVKVFDERVEEEARQRVITDHVDEEAEQMRLRIVAARTLRAKGLAVWDRFAALVDAGGLEEMTLERLKHVVTLEGSPATGTTEEKPASRVEREVPSIFTQLGLAREAIAEGLKQERLEMGEVTDRSAVDLTEQRGAIDKELEAMGKDGRAALRRVLEDLIGDSGAED